MTGGGFGGCAVALVASEHAATFAKNVAKSYQAKTSKEPQIYVCEPSAGAGVV
jgi:galactokinase